jgi:hypothetical protein
MDFKDYKKPDLKAPRFRKERLSILNKDFYKEFREKFPEYKHIKDSELGLIINTFNKTLWKEVINNRDGVELPEGLGYLFIGSCPPPTGKNIDSPNSLKYGKQVKNTNLNSDGFLAKIFYSSFASKYKYEFRKLWKFKGCRDFTRATSKAYRENWKTYVQVDKRVMISKLYQRQVKRDIMKKLAKTKLDNYNEFDLD